MSDRRKSAIEVIRRINPTELFTQMHTITKQRLDQRHFDSFRPSTVSCGSPHLFEHALGSSLVRHGDSTCLGYVIGTLRSFERNEQLEDLQINVRVFFTSQVESHAEINSITQEARSSKISDRLIQLLNKSINKQSLLYQWTSGFGLAWNLRIEIAILEEDGSLMDTCLLCAMMAIKDTILPQICVEKDRSNGCYVARTIPKPRIKADSDKTQMIKDQNIEIKKKSCIYVDERVIALTSFPISITFAIFPVKGEMFLFADPSLEEEDKIGMSTFSLIFDILRREKRGQVAMIKDQDCKQKDKENKEQINQIDEINEFVSNSPVFWLMLKDGGIPIILDLNEVGMQVDQSKDSSQSYLLIGESGQTIDVNNPFVGFHNNWIDGALIKKNISGSACIGKNVFDIARKRASDIAQNLINKQQMD